MLMRDHEVFYRLAIYAFVLRRQQEEMQTVFPQSDFLRFSKEFIAKLSLVLRGKGTAQPIPLLKLTIN